MHFATDTEERMEYYISFKFEAKWQLDDEYGAILEEAWHGGNIGVMGLQPVQNKLGMCQEAFSRWSGLKYENAEKLIKKKTRSWRSYN